MSISRRTFLKNTSLTIAGTSLLSGQLAATANKAGEVMGIQLYSIREDMKNDPAGTLKLLAAMGYKYVEHANYVDRKFMVMTQRLLRNYSVILTLKCRVGIL